MASMGEGADLVVLYSIVVCMGEKELGSTQRRYREFANLNDLLHVNYPHLFPEDDDGASFVANQRLVPPFPRKYWLRAGWDPEVVVERVSMLNSWLERVCNKLQFASVELVSFLNVPLYAAIRMLSGDLQPADLTEPCSPESVVTADLSGRGLEARLIERDGSDLSSLGDAKGTAALANVRLSPSHTRSPHIDRRSLHTLGSKLHHSVQRPGYNESALFLARAVCSHARAANQAQLDVPVGDAYLPPSPRSPTRSPTRSSPSPHAPRSPLPSSLAPASGAFGGEGTGGPALEETHRFVRTVCGRALFKPCSLIASVLYMERLHKKHQLYPLLQVDGWRVVTLTLLVIGAKVWDSDYPISNGDICSERSEPAKSVGSVCAAGEARRVNDCERRVLSLLDYRIHVSQAEFARAYLTIPFAFRVSALIRSDQHDHDRRTCALDVGSVVPLSPLDDITIP